MNSLSNVIKSTRLFITTPVGNESKPIHKEKKASMDGIIQQATKLIEEAQKEAKSIIREAEIKSKDIIKEAEATIKEEAITIHTKAKEDGWQAGYNKGLLEAKDEISNQTSKGLETVENIIREATEARDRSLRLLEEDFLKLSLILAEKIVKEQISLRPDWLRPVVQAALDRLSTVEEIRVQLNAKDYESLVDLQEIVTGSNSTIQWEPDDSLSPGSCYISTEFGTIDASLEQRFSKLADELQDVVYREQ